MLSNSFRNIHSSAWLGCSVLQLMPTIASADFSQQTIFNHRHNASTNTCIRETSQDMSLVFPCPPTRSMLMDYGRLLDLTSLCQLIRHECIKSGFYTTDYNFAFFSFCLHIIMKTLNISIEFAGNYTSMNYHHRQYARYT